MSEFAREIFTAPLATILIISGIIFLLIAVVGNISGKIEPDVKGRIASGILGLVFFLTGFTLYLQESGQRTVLSPPDQNRSKRLPSPEPPVSLPKDKTLPSPQAQKSVSAKVTRFEKIGELVTVELVLQNTTSSLVNCINFGIEFNGMKLIDEASGEAWEPLHTGGSLSNCLQLPPDAFLGGWAKFKIADPERKNFSLSINALPRPFSNLKIGNPFSERDHLIILRVSSN